jgi:hypothetical protein
MASALPVSINQCNGSALGGGGLVICSASMVSHAIPLPAPTSTADAGSSGSSTPPLPLMIVLALGGFVLAAVVSTKRRTVNS